MKTLRDLIILLFSLTLISTKCENGSDCQTRLINNTSDKLIYECYCSNTKNNVNWTAVFFQKIVSPHSNKKICEDESWKDRFSRFETTDTLKIFIFNIDSVGTSYLDEILAQKKYCKYINVTWEELERNNWFLEIVYP